MRKKLVLALLMTALLAGGAFAQISAGIGGTLTADFMNYVWTSDGENILDTLKIDKDSSNQNFIGNGFFAYLDTTYAMASLGMGFYTISPANADLKKAQDDAKITNSLTTFDISLYGKYPISLGIATLFPMLGVDYKIAVAQDYTVDGEKSTWKDRNKDDSVGDYWNSLWFKVGAGADIPLGKKLYIRPMFLYGLGTLPKSAQESMDAMNILVKTVDNIIYHGLDLKLAVGYKF